jgi:hypothetical protein
MPTQLDQIVTIAPEVWPGEELQYQPGDLSMFTPLGLGLGPPLVMQPWDNLDDLSQRGTYYGLDRRTGHPLLDAPLTGSSGGTVYFDGSPERGDLDTLLRVLTVHVESTDYAVFLGEAKNPQAERFLIQVRLMSRFALQSMFGAKVDGESSQLTTQLVSIGDLIWKFIEDQQREYGTGYSAQLNGLFGGDGDWAKEKLAFGFMVENEYQGVYRLWSRAWLVTK